MRRQYKAGIADSQSGVNMDNIFIAMTGDMLATPTVLAIESAWLRLEGG